MTAGDARILLAFDIGKARTGVAIANTVARIASPLTTLHGEETLAEDMTKLATEQQAALIVLGLPRNMSGETTNQTRFVQQIAEKVRSNTNIPLYLIDEAVTSAQAEQELVSRKQPFQKEDIDMLAATYILEDFMREHAELL